MQPAMQSPAGTLFIGGLSTIASEEEENYTCLSFSNQNGLVVDPEAPLV